jgi:hypothetical protein
MQYAHPPELRVEEMSHVEKSVKQAIERRNPICKGIDLGIEQDEEK